MAKMVPTAKDVVVVDKPTLTSRTAISMILIFLIQLAKAKGWIPEGWDPVLIENVTNSVTGAIENATSLSDVLTALLAIAGIIFRSKVKQVAVDTKDAVVAAPKNAWSWFTGLFKAHAK